MNHRSVEKDKVLKSGPKGTGMTVIGKMIKLMGMDD